MTTISWIHIGVASLILLVNAKVIAFQFIVHTNPNMTKIDSANQRSCLVIVHDNIRGFLNWNQDWFVKAAKNQNVRLKEMKEVGIKAHNSLQDADAVIFHAATHHNRISPLLLRQRYGSNAVFAMLSMEQPNYAPIMKDYHYLQSAFDLMITYSLAPIYPNTRLANMPITYYPSHILPGNAVLQPPKLSYEKKNGYGTGVMVALFTSNCKIAGAAERLKYLQELMQYIEVHSYGGCLNNRKEPEMPDDPAWPAIAQRRARKITVLSNYRFYLAFENAPIEDYVSEKVFEGLFAGVIPIYRGAKSINSFMPANDSFINANDMSPKELATLIKLVGNDRHRYSSYFSFKEKTLSPHFQSIVDRSYVHPNVLRRICDYAQTAAPSKETKTIVPSNSVLNSNEETSEVESENEIDISAHEMKPNHKKNPSHKQQGGKKKPSPRKIKPKTKFQKTK